MGSAALVKVSVIIPVYNGQAYLADTLDNVLKQPIDSLEIICIDEGSTDASLEQLRQYEKKYKQVRVIVQKNQGSGVARNRGLKEARGEFVAFMDADDCYPNSGVLNLLYQKALEANVAIVGGSFSEFSASHKREKYAGILSGYTFQTEELMDYKNYQFDYGYHRFLYNRKFLLDNQIQFPAYRRFQDPPFFVTAMIAAGQFYAVPDITYCYRVAHKKIAWTEQQVKDLFTGLLHDLQLAVDNQLEKLYWITLIRIQGEFREIIYSACYQGNGQMEVLLQRLKLLLEQQQLSGWKNFCLYTDIKWFVRCGLRDCEKRTVRKNISKYKKVKRLINGNYIVMNGWQYPIEKLTEKMKSREIQ